MTKMLLTVALLCASLSLQGTASARASSDASQPDQVIQWNRTLLQILQTPGAQPATIHPTRSMAIVHLAIYDAVNAIMRGHAPYLVLHAPRRASPDAAAAAAAHTALLSLFPSQQSVIDAKFQDSLSQIGGGAHVRHGIRSGRRPPPPSSPRARTTGRTAPRPCSCRSRGRARTTSRPRTSSRPPS